MELTRDNTPPENYRLITKSPVQGMGKLLLLSYTIQAMATALDYISELYEKILLLKTPHNYVIEHGKNQAGIDQELSSLLASFHSIRRYLCRLLGVIITIL